MAEGQTVASASVSGTVSDPSGVLPGAAVRLRNVETNEIREAAADDRGRFRLLSVPVSRYELTATAVDLAPATVPLTLTV
ncbi:MAG: carboxypeptidase-like regulatory domain-containing protein, partial [Vicinamibacterales bacterium]